MPLLDHKMPKRPASRFSTGETLVGRRSQARTQSYVRHADLENATFLRLLGIYGWSSNASPLGHVPAQQNSEEVQDNQWRA